MSPSVIEPIAKTETAKIAKEAARLRAVLSVGRKVTSILDLDHLLAESVRLIQQTFDYELVTIFVRDQHDDDYYFNNHYSGNTDLIAQRQQGKTGRIICRNHISKGMVGWVFRHEQHRLRINNEVSAIA